MDNVAAGPHWVDRAAGRQQEDSEDMRALLRYCGAEGIERLRIGLLARLRRVERNAWCSAIGVGLAHWRRSRRILSSANQEREAAADAHPEKRLDQRKDDWHDKRGNAMPPLTRCPLTAQLCRARPRTRLRGRLHRRDGMRECLTHLRIPPRINIASPSRPSSFLAAHRYQIPLCLPSKSYRSSSCLSMSRT